jgi:hypothetical protein
MDDGKMDEVKDDNNFNNEKHKENSNISCIKSDPLLTNKEVKISVDRDDIINDIKLSDIAKDENDLKKSLVSSKNRRSFSERWFSKINPDSMRGNIFNLSIIAFGTATLALPVHFRNMSLVVGIINTLICGLASFWTLNMLVIAGVKHGIFDYAEIVRRLYGKTMSKVLDIVITIYILGQMILYQVISK